MATQAVLILSLALTIYATPEFYLSNDRLMDGYFTNATEFIEGLYAGTQADIEHPSACALGFDLFYMSAQTAARDMQSVLKGDITDLKEFIIDVDNAYDIATTRLNNTDCHWDDLG